MRKKFVKSSRPTYKRRIKKAQQGMRFVSYNTVSNPTIDITDITNPTNPFSEYNFSTTYNKPDALVVPVREDNAEIESPVVNDVVIDKPIASKPVTKTPKSYKGLAAFNKAYDEVVASNPEAAKYRQFLTKMAEQESGFDSVIQNRAGAPAYGYFQFMQDDKKYNNIKQYAGTDVETFRNNPKLQIEAAIKLAKSFEKGFNKEDLELAKQRGYSTWGLLGGAWLAGNGGVRKFLKGQGNPSDRHWSKEGKGTDVASRIKAFNFKEGGIVKYQQPSSGIQRRDAIKDYKPQMPIAPIKQRYMPTQQPMLSQDNRSAWEKEVSNQIKADKAKNNNLYDNQHVWNWSAPFINARTTKDNASAMFDFDKSSAMGTFAIGTGIANPVATGISMTGSLVGAGIGNKVAGEKGALIGGFIGGLAGNKAFNTAKNASKNLGIVAKPFQGESDITDNLIKLIGGHTRGASTSIDKLRGLEKLQAIKLQEAGIDLSRLSVQDLQKAINLRKQELVKSAPNGRVNIIKPEAQYSNTQEVLDFINDNGKFTPVGNTKLSLRDDILISNTQNIATVPNVHKVEERALNSAIQLAQQTGRKGVRTGQELNSAPKTYSVWKHFNDKELIGNFGVHSNTNMIDEAIQAGKLKNSLELDEEVLINSIEQMKGDANRRLLFLNGPVYRLTKQSGLPTKTKSVLFDPKIIDSFGKMHVDWSNPDIYKVGIPTIIGTKLISNGDR